MGRMTGKTILITGAAGGQGSAEARRFAAEGGAVVLTDVNERAVRDVATSIQEEGGRTLFLKHDVSLESEWEAVIEASKTAFGGLHVLVNNAGTRTRQGIASTPLEVWNQQLGINLTGPMLGMKHAAPLIRDSGGGSIINVSSAVAFVGHDDAAYTATKWGLRGLTKTAAIEFVSWGIRVNSIHPGMITDTGFARGAVPGHVEAMRQSVPMGRAGTPKECSDLVFFLASDEATFITGAEISIDGGFIAGASYWMRNNLRDKIVENARASPST